ncbi:MAG TPA: cyclic nucleotide-binding domain-containing protein [Frankiaceae bacterium]|nr:cyclic nucleotide-binding domain-containing protein [Frankiaceae bacterium]
MRSKSRKVEILRDVALFGLCTRKELNDIAGLVDELSVKQGDALTTEGTPGRECFVVVSGEAEATVRGKRIATIGAGECVGEMALLDTAPRTATVTALTDMELLVLEPRSFGDLLDRHPSVAKRLLATLARRLREASDSPAYTHWAYAARDAVA